MVKKLKLSESVSSGTSSNLPSMDELRDDLAYGLYELCDDWYDGTHIGVFNKGDNIIIIATESESNMQGETTIPVEEFRDFSDKDFSNLINNILYYGHIVEDTYQAESKRSSRCTEEIDPFKGLEKVPNGAARDCQFGKCVGDGWGNTYKIPTSGRSAKIQRGAHNFRYDYAHKELVMYSKSNQELDRQGLNPSDWFDGPEYWCDYMNDEWQADADFDR